MERYGMQGVWSSHIFKWVTDDTGYDVNHNGTVDVLDLNIIGQHYGEATTAPYADYDVNEDGMVNMLDLLLVSLHMGVVQ